MQRKKFILTALMAVPPLLGFGNAFLSDKKPRKPFKVDAGKGRFNENFMFRGANPNNIKLSGSDTDGGLVMFEYEGFEKIGPTLHVHFKQDETFYVVEGEYRFVVGERTEILKAGDTIFLPRNVPHTWIQLSEKGKLIYLLHPAGKFEDFIRKLSTMKTPPTPEEFDRITLSHDMKNVGPPLTL